MCRSIFRILVVAGFVIALCWTGEAQLQTPTSPNTNPNQGSLRSQLRQTLSGLRNRQTGQEDATGTDQTRGSRTGLGTRGRESTRLDKKDEKTEKEQKAATPEAQSSQPPAARKEPTKTAEPAAGPKVTGGKTQAAIRATGAVAAPGGGPAAATAARTVGTGTYEPVKDRKLTYGDVPDEGDVMTCNGPMPAGEFLDTLAMATNWNVLVTEQARNINLQFWIAETKPKQALEILKFHDIFYEWNPETKYLYVMTKQEYLDKQFGQLTEQEFVAQYASIDYLESVLTPLLSPKGRMLSDPRTHHLFVWDTKDNIAKMQETVKQLDVPLDEAEFVVKYAAVTDIEAVMTTLMSPSGSVITDPRTGHILVRDLPENLAQMRTTVAKLDVPLEPRLFKIYHVNADALMESAESLLSERGTIQLDSRTNTLVVTDLPNRQQQIADIIATMDKPLETRTWTIKYLEPEDIADRIEVLVPEEMGSIVTDEDVHQVTVTAIPERLAEIDRLIQAWDAKRRQVQIEAFLVEMNSKLARSLNISWSYFDSTGNAPQAYRIGNGAAPDYTEEITDTIAIGQLPYAEPLRNLVTGDVIKDIRGQDIIKELHGNRVAAVLNYLDTHGEASVLSAPRVTVQDGEEALFQNGRQVPYINSTTYDYGAPYYGGGETVPGQNYYGYGYGARPYNRVDFIEVGTILRVLPRIAEDQTILLDIVAEDSDATFRELKSSGQENTVPEKFESVAETQVRVQDGQTIVIGGLRKSNSTNDISRSLPVLADIPILGRLFKNPSKSISNTSLMIFITSTIVDEMTHPEAERLAQFDQQFVDDIRKAKKTSFGRFVDTITRGNVELTISIGQSGHMHYEGNPVTLDDLRKAFHQVKHPTLSKVIVRRHPRAPESVVTEVVEAALEANLKVDFDTSLTPFVPNYESMTGGDKPVPAGAMPTKTTKPKDPDIPQAITKPPEPLQEPKAEEDATPES